MESQTLPPSFRTVNSVSIETASGYKTFNLVHGDVTLLPSDLLVISATGEPDYPMVGMVLTALHRRYNIVIDPDCRWLNFAEGRWTCYQEQTGPEPFQAILTARIPQIARQEDPLSFYDEAVCGVFASIAALEYMKKSFPIVSLPVLYGQRLLPDHRPGAVESLIRHGLHWLKKSNHTHTIQFVVFNADELDAWDAAMNVCMGRALVAAGTDGVINSLCQEIAQRARSERDPRLQSPLGSLAHALDHPEKSYVENVCVFGRKMVEEMLHVLMPQWQLTLKGSLLSDIETLRSSNRVAPWITSYMHSLRVFGNETVHAKD